ncbi:hypothetical protein PInf_011887 [Phytophthora infestans]|nr:hypothetical protein PInf_011887 [Phytophthora infestans]
MELRGRETRKRRQPAGASGGSVSEDSDNVSESWCVASQASRGGKSDTSSHFETAESRTSSEAAGAQSDSHTLPSDSTVASSLEQTQLDSWEAFNDYLEKYSSRPFQNFRIRTVSKVVDRNRKITQTKSTAALIPVEWKQYNKTLICTHAGTFKSRSKGKRPRQESRAMKCRAQEKPKVAHAKRNIEIAMAREDSLMYNQDLNLQTAATMLNDAMSFESAGSVLTKFKVFVVSKKTKAHVARETIKLPPSKQPMHLDELVRVLPKDILRKCDTYMTALQRTRSGLPEQDIAVEVPGIGVFSTATLSVIKSYHRARATILVVERAVKLLGTIDFTHQLGPDFAIDCDAATHLKIRDLRLLSSEMEVLDLAAKGRLSDVTMSTVFNKVFGPSPDVIVVSPHAITVSMNIGHMDVDTLKGSFFGAATERVLIPINCNSSHWCAIMISLATGEVKCYDPMQSTYKVGVRAKAEQLKALLPDRAGRYHVGFYDADFGIQTDSYNCGIYVLLASEVFSGATSPGVVDSQKLRCLRYRYLKMCM